MSPCYYNLANQPAMNEKVGVILFLLGMMVLFVILLFKVLMTWAFCRICSKTGYSWAMGLLMLVPIANVVLTLFLAFSDWPVQKEIRKLQSQAPAPQ